MTIPSRPDNIRFHTLKFCSDALSISKRTLYRLIASGDFPKPIKVGCSLRIDADDLAAYVNRQKQQGAR